MSENMNDIFGKFERNLQRIVESNTSTIHVTAPVTDNSYVTFDDDIETISSSLKVYGGIIKSVDEDTIIIRCISKDSFEQTIDYLDSDDRIDAYDLNMWVTDPLSGITSEVGEIDLDSLPTFKNLTVEIIAFVAPQYVQYDSYYDDYYDDESDVVDDMSLSESLKKKPLVVAIAQVNANTHGGKFIVTPSPKDKSAVWVSIEYKFDKSTPHSEFYKKNKDNIKKDLDVVNTGIINKKFKEKGLKCSGKLTLSDSDVTQAEKHGQAGYLDTPNALEFKGDGDINCMQLLEMFVGSTLHAAPSVLHEIERKIKINFRGVKRIKMQCMKGFKYDSNRRVCVKIGGAELATSRRSKIKATRTKRSLGSGYNIRMQRKTKKAKRFRKLLGVK